MNHSQDGSDSANIERYKGWEQYNPCPDCGAEQYDERVVAYRKSTSMDGEMDYFDVDHIGEALEIHCGKCQTLLLERPKEQAGR